jgi:NADH-quinone oxidoreductase subunit J
MPWITNHWPDILSLVLIAAGVLWLMPRGAYRAKPAGLLLALAGTVLMAIHLHVSEQPVVQTSLFGLFAATAIFCAILMVTNRNPVYSALWFAMVTLSVCGLFLLQSAPFLAAATVIVYAGAIVVTFVFVIMLAQQSGATVYDQRARQPIIATVASMVLLAMILGSLELARDESGAVRASDEGGVARGSGESVVRGSPDPAQGQSLARAGSEDPRTTERDARTTTAPAAMANTLSQPRSGESLGALHGLGRSLFGDYLFAVELAGTLLLVATIGAIAIAPRRSRGTL